MASGRRKEPVAPLSLSDAATYARIGSKRRLSTYDRSGTASGRMNAPVAPRIFSGGLISANS